jgi:hypothetical protein
MAEVEARRKRTPIPTRIELLIAFSPEWKKSPGQQHPGDFGSHKHAN